MFTNRGEPDLSFIQADINLRDVSRLETKKVIHLTNEFLLRIADISNSFMQNMESKIFELEKKIDALDTVLVLVETKLENVQSKNTADIPPPPATNFEESKVIEPLPSATAEASPEIVPTTITPTSAEEPVIIEVKQNTPAAIIPEETKIDEGKIKISEHPIFLKYFKMLRLGIPELGVRQKMASEGVDANLLDTPNALIDAPKPEESDDGSESDSSFSSSD